MSETGHERSAFGLSGTGAKQQQTATCPGNPVAAAKNGTGGMMRLLVRGFVVVLGVVLQVQIGQAGVLDQAIRRSVLIRAERAAVLRALERDAARDAASPALILRRGATMSRYATSEEAAIEAKQGLRAGQHLTGPVEPKKLLSIPEAVKRYGLLHKTPEVRETWSLPKGMPIKVNPALGGNRGAKETVVARPLGPESLIKVEPLRPN